MPDRSERCSEEMPNFAADMRVMCFIRRWTLPVAMAVGIVLFALAPSLFIDKKSGGTGIVACLFPITLFITLFATFARVDFRAMRLRRWHLRLMLAQIAIVGLLLSLAICCPLESTPRLVSASLLTCAIAPCAAAAPVVTSQIGGSLVSMTTFMLLSCLLCVVTIPLVFPLLAPHAGIGFLSTACAILRRLAAVLLLPLAMGWLVRHYLHGLYNWLTLHTQLSFYAWCLSLAMISGLTVRNIVGSSFPAVAVAIVAAGSLAICLVQYLLGHLIGRHSPELVNARQGMFQKNTALAIYISTIFLPPAAAIGAGCYVLWQNIVNSYELRKR